MILKSLLRFNKKDLFGYSLNNKNLNFGFSSNKTVFLFGGQGNQQKGMLDKFDQNTEASEIIKQSSQKLGIDLLQISKTDKDNLINITKYTQPLLLLSQYLQFKFGQKRINFSNHSYPNTYCIGHSLGQYTALLLAGSINLQDCLNLVYQRGALMIKSSSSDIKLGTLIIKFRQDKLPKILQNVQKLQLQVSCYNSPTNIVVSGNISALTELKDYMKSELRIVSKVLPAATAFHSTHLKPMQNQYKQILQKIEFKKPNLQILRNLDTKIYQDKADIVEGLLYQNTNPVLFTQSIHEIIKKEGKQNLQFIQIGHKQYLNRWVDQVKKLY